MQPKNELEDFIKDPGVCHGGLEVMYDSEGNLANQRWTALLPRLSPGYTYGIHAIYNVSSGGRNKMLVHLTDDENSSHPSDHGAPVEFKFNLSMITEIKGADPIDATKNICVGIFHENDPIYFAKIEQHAFRVFHATRDRSLCDHMSYREIFGDESPDNFREPKRCGGGLVVVG